MDGMPAFMNVEDDTTGEEGVDYTGESATRLMGSQLQVPWDGLQYNDRHKVGLRDNDDHSRES